MVTDLFNEPRVTFERRTKALARARDQGFIDTAVIHLN